MVEVVVVGLSVCSSSSSVASGRSGNILEAVVESRQGVHSMTSRRRGQSWQQPLVVAVVSRQGVVESRQGVAVVFVVADVAVVSGVSGSSTVVSAALVFDW